MRRAAALLGFVALAGCALSSTALEGPGPTAAEVARTYGGLTRMTSQAVPIDERLARLCRLPGPDEGSGPHQGMSVRIFMSEGAARAFERSSPRFPVGSVVVTEKRSQWSEPGVAPQGVGGMIKRPPGYDPAHGDWEYFYFERPERIESGRLAACVACHNGAKAKDHVFGSWRSRDRRS